MISETHIEESPNRDKRNHELVRGILGIGLLAALLCGVLVLLRRRKAIFLRPLMALVIVVLSLVLLGAFQKALHSRRFDQT